MSSAFALSRIPRLDNPSLPKSAFEQIDIGIQSRSEPNQ